MDDIMDGTVFTNATGNGHLKQERCGENEKIDTQDTEDKRFESLNSLHCKLKNNRKNDDQLKGIFKSDSSHEREKVVTTSYLLDNNLKDTYSKTLNSENSYRGERSETNGLLRSQDDPMSIHLIVSLKQHKNESRLSGKSLSSDEYYEECESTNNISKSISSELNTNRNRADSLRRNADDGNSSVRQEHHVSKSSSELHQSSRRQVSEKEHAKKKISFRALVRMKGLGRKLRRKSKHKQINNKSEAQTKDPLFFSDSSAKYLLESSTSVTDEYLQCKHTITEHDELPKQLKNKKSYSFSETNTPDHIFQDDMDSSSSEIVCSTEYLEKRRSAVCEEIEKNVICGEQNLAELRSILVIQHKLTGFGLL